MVPDRVSNPGPLTYESGALLIALRGPALEIRLSKCVFKLFVSWEQCFQPISFRVKTLKALNLTQKGQEKVVSLS